MVFNGRSKYITISYILVDIFLMSISFLVTTDLKYFELSKSDGKSLPILFLFLFIWVLINLTHDLYDVPRTKYTYKIISRHLNAIFQFALVSMSFIYLLQIEWLNRYQIVCFIAVFGILILFWHSIIILFFKKLRASGYNEKKVVFAGLNKNIETIISKIENNPQFGYKIEALFTDALVDEYNSILIKKGNLDQVMGYCKRNRVDELMISLPHHKSEMIKEFLRFGENNLIRVSIIPEYSEYLDQVFSIKYFDTIPNIVFREEPLERLGNKILKRGFDIVFSWTVIILIFTWLFPIISILIKLTSKGPIFFTQLRSGKNDTPFKCYKFRTMKVNTDSDTKQATKDDSRITSIGKFLRKTSLDELPQFFNVVNKDMSIVGPRPHMLKHTDEYRRLINKYMVRHYAKPGITGWAQINGFRGETKNLTDMQNRVLSDIWYIENWSFFLDLKIILLTIWRSFVKPDSKAY